MYLSRLQEHLPRVRDRIEQALSRSGLSGAVEVVAVTKGYPVAAVEAALACSLRRCGENRVHELEEKVARAGRDRVEWHLIGHLQRNKARRALALFDLLHSLDSLRLAVELSREAERSGRDIACLVQVNTSGEVSKGGFAPAEARDAVAQIVELPRLRLEGVMTMAPLTGDEGVLRRAFAGARELFEAWGRGLPGFQARHLSMGMSNDFEVAVEEGSTMVRLGTVLFGERTP